MVRSQTFGLSPGLVFMAAVAAGVLFAVSARAEVPVAPTLPTWPAFTMTYETDGIVYTVGASPPETTRETRRLDYQSSTQWTDTVVDAPTITTSVASTSRVGAYSELEGNSFIEFDSSGERIYEDTIDENTTLIVGSMPPPFPIEEMDVDLESVTTGATVCFYDECISNAPGLLYTEANGRELVFVDDARGIPLRVNHSFVVHEIRIEDVRQPLGR